ncbi:uncharacterized protein LOC129606492 [Condylostylus longicornis]|uniref:uncharacterized protein LOC129606492 n=1 Tax=Condylostylus longicornis TaxID=2530218 RepID=UPI00244DFCB2|nr:uncharacterized protein LOC129606492 [Condylostylus longicornis]
MQPESSQSSSIINDLVKFHFAKDYNTNAVIYATINPYEIRNDFDLNSNQMINSLKSSLNGIHEALLCRKLWILKFYRISIFISNSIDYKIITYTPFPKVHLIDITNYDDSTSLLYRKTTLNVHKRAMRTIVYDSELQLSGSHLLVVINYINYINATFKIINTEVGRSNMNISQVLKLVHDKKIDISGHGTAVNRREYYGNFNRVTSSYPYDSSSLCIMVPFSKEIEQYLYTYLPFDPFVWLTLVNLIFYMTLIKIIILHLSPTDDYSKFIGSAFSTSVSEVFFLPTSRPKKYQLNFIQMIIIILPYSLGFILSNVYMTKLSSYLTVSLFEPQTNTIEDLLKSKIKVLISETIFELTDTNTKKRHQSILNTSYGYVIDDDKIEFYLSQQRYSKRPIFRKSQICLQKGLIGFFMPTDSIYEESFNHYIMKISETGLQHIWKEQSFIDAFKYGEGKFLYKDSSLLRHDLLRLQNVLGAFILWGSGCFLSLLIFLIERSIPYFKNHFAILNISQK